MKLFAVTATLATAVPWYQKYQPYRYQRVDRPDFPGPGHINEQGGYWADQPSVQSNSYQQPGQPSMPQPPHSTQAPQRDHQIHIPDPPKCCTELKFNAPNGDTVILRQSGFHDDKALYEGVHNGMKQVLWWEFHDAGNSNMIPQAIPGEWHIGTAIGDRALSSFTTTGLRYCPDAQENGSSQANDWDFRCNGNPIPPPPRVLTCEKSNESVHNRRGIWLTQGDQKTCHMQNLMNILVQDQFTQLKAFHPESLKGDVNKFYSDALNAWGSLMGNWPNQCGSTVLTNWNQWSQQWEKLPGYTDQCDVVCEKIDNLNSPADFAAVLEQFVTVAMQSFTDG